MIAFQFLTIVPLRIKGNVNETDMAASASFFPIVGAFQGLLISLSAFFLLMLFPPVIVSALVALLLIISNGGFDIDGLADTFDAFAVKGSGDPTRDREKRLSVMKDSFTGAIGTSAIVFAILLKVLFLNQLLAAFQASGAAYLIIFMMPVFSKWITIPAMYHGLAARKDGLGRIFIENIGFSSLFLASALTVTICLLAGLQSHNAFNGNLLMLFCAACFIFMYMFSLMSSGFCKKMFGGLTGDTLGALTEISEILYLAGASIWLQRSI